MTSGPLATFTGWLQDLDPAAAEPAPPIEMSPDEWMDVLKTLPPLRDAWPLELGIHRDEAIAALETWCAAAGSERHPSFGYLALVLITLESLAETDRKTWPGAAHVRKAPSPAHDCAGICQALTDTREVQRAIRDVYRCGLPAAGPHAERGAHARDDLRRAAGQWDDVDWDTVEFYRHGTTSFILSAVMAHSPVAVKCILGPFARIAVVASATRTYRREYDMTPSDADDGVQPRRRRRRRRPRADPEVVSDTSHVIRVWASTDAWILMELVPGPTLQELIEEDEPAAASRHEPRLGERLRSTLRGLAGAERSEGIALDRLDTLGPALFKALAQLQRAGRVHGDLVPSNIIVSGYEPPEAGRPALPHLKLIDFGPNYLYTKVLPGIESIDRVYIAPEVRAGDEPTAASDVFSLGQLLVSTSGARRQSDEYVPDDLYARAAPLARFVEDLVDRDPDFRLALSAPVTSLPDLQAVLHSQISLVRTAERLDASANGGVLRGILRSMPFVDAPVRQFRLAREYRRQRRDHHRTHAAIALGPYADYLAAFSLWSATAWCVTATVVLTWTLRDHAASSAVRDIASFAGLIPDSIADWLDRLRQPEYHVPPSNQHDVLTNLSARMIGFSFAMVGAKYYGNIMASLTPLTARRVASPGIRFHAVLAEVSCRWLMSWWWAALILIATLIDARWWPLCSAVGLTAALLSNYSWRMICLGVVREVNRDERAPVGVAPRAVGQITGLSGFVKWAPTMLFYWLALWVIGWLLVAGVLQDEIVYAGCVTAINVVLFYVMRCGLEARDVRIGLTRIVFAAERLSLRRRPDLP